MRWALAMRLAVDEINNSTALLPNHTLGYRIFDSCATPITAQRGVLAVMNEQNVGPGSLCTPGGPLHAIVGESGSSQSIVVSRTLQPFKIPMVKGNTFSFYIIHLSIFKDKLVSKMSKCFFLCFTDKLLFNLLLFK